MQRLSRLVHDAWSLGVPFWRSEERWRARGYLAAVAVLNLGLVGITVMLTYWQRAFYNALEAKDWSGFIALLLWWHATPSDGFVPSFALLAVAFVPITAYALYLRQALQIQWRRWSTERYMTAWVADRAYYHMALMDPGTDNADQRLAEDIRLYVDGALTLGVGAFKAFVSLGSFVVLLWTLSDTVMLFHGAIPGSLVWIALAYSVVGTGCAHLVGRRLTPLNVTEQKVEADFRFNLMRFRENAESIAFYGGEADEHRALSGRFSAIIDNWHAIMAVTRRLTLFTTGFGQLALVFPWAVVAPAYFAGRMPLGGIFQISNAFVQVQGALSWFVDNYTALTAWFATVERLERFKRSVRTLGQPHGPQVTRSGDIVRLSQLRVALPDGGELFRQIDLEMRRVERILLEGVSGAGKSTLFRAMAGIWPFGEGRIQLPDGRRLFLPQRAYVPTGSLKRAACYPMHAEDVTDAEVDLALHDAGLGHFQARLHEVRDWDGCLSGGERQRLALARTLLFKPDWIFIDEATAHLDGASEQAFYLKLRERLPDAGWISIAHRPELDAFHDRFLSVSEGRLESGRVSRRTS
jgi:vitamin B12/bleomycin/antimicrobial peptide transport system ATP-binding/permease protein